MLVYQRLPSPELCIAGVSRKSDKQPQLLNNRVPKHRHDEAGALAALDCREVATFYSRLKKEG